MKNHEIEMWAADIVERVRRNQPNEDSRVELKADWIDSKKAARAIAGHANAARGDRILWLIGIDEKTGVCGVKAENLANWWPQVKSRFDGPCPEMKDLNIGFGAECVVALLFQTDRPPYVVRTDGVGPCTLEVPWREGTSTRSASRLDLLRLLVPLTRRPNIEVIRADVVAKKRGEPGKPIQMHWRAAIQAYFVSADGNRLIIPIHRLRLVFHPSPDGSPIEFPDSVILPYERSTRYGHLQPSATVRTSQNEAVIEGAGLGVITAEFDSILDLIPADSDPRLIATVEVSGSDSPVVIDCELRRSPNSSCDAFWSSR